MMKGLYRKVKIIKVTWIRIIYISKIKWRQIYSFYIWELSNWRLLSLNGLLLAIDKMIVVIMWRKSKVNALCITLTVLVSGERFLHNITLNFPFSNKSWWSSNKNSLIRALYFFLGISAAINTVTNSEGTRLKNKIDKCWLASILCGWFISYAKSQGIN